MLRESFEEEMSHKLTQSGRGLSNSEEGKEKAEKSDRLRKGKGSDDRQESEQKEG